MTSDLKNWDTSYKKIIIRPRPWPTELVRAVKKMAKEGTLEFCTYNPRTKNFEPLK